MGLCRLLLLHIPQITFTTIVIMVLQELNTLIHHHNTHTHHHLLHQSLHTHRHHLLKLLQWLKIKCPYSLRKPPCTTSLIPNIHSIITRQCSRHHLPHRLCLLVPLYLRHLHPRIRPHLPLLRRVGRVVSIRDPMTKGLPRRWECLASVNMGI